MSYYASKHMQDGILYHKWLQYFYENADFGPAEDDVYQMMWEDFLEEEGLKEEIDDTQL